jgi:hypothetical protein
MPLQLIVVICMPQSAEHSRVLFAPGVDAGERLGFRGPAAPCKSYTVNLEL